MGDSWLARLRIPGFGLIAMIGLLTAVGPLSIDMYLPSLPTIADELGVSSSAVQQSVSAFFLGLAAGQLVYGPLSDRFGRRPALLLGFGLYLLASLACATAGSVHLLIVARAVQGLGAAATPAAGRAIVRDRWKGDEAARAMSFVVMVMGIAPLLAPLVGGQILAWLGWRAIFWALTGFALLSLLLVGFVLPETHGPERRQGMHMVTVYRAYGALLKDARIRWYLLCGGLIYASMFAYITSAPAVYIRIFGVDPQHFGLYFGLNVVGMLIGNYANGRLVTRFGYRRLLGVGAAVSLLATLALLGCALAGVGGLVAVVATLFFAVGAVGMVGGNAIAGMLDLYPRNAGAASALFGVAQYGLGAAAGAVVGALYAGTPVAMGGVMAVAGVGAYASYRRLRALDRRNDHMTAS